MEAVPARMSLDAMAPPRAAAGAVAVSRVPELDGVRGLAILMVMVWHVAALLVTDSPWRLFSNKSAILLRTGVDLFFVLSGYLITGILMDNAGSPRYFQTFYVRRILRIFPLYYAMLGVAVLAHALGWDHWLFSLKFPLWSYLTFTQNYFVTPTNFGGVWMGVTWSLAVEEQFYLLLPAVVRFTPRKWLVRVFLAGVVLAVVARLLLYSPAGYGACYTWLVCRLDAMLIGSLIACSVRNEAFLARLRDRRADLARLLGLVAAGLPVLGWFVASGDLGWHMAFWGHSYLALFYGLVVLLAVLYQGDPILSFLRGRTLVGLGITSYALYMLHYVVLHLFLYNRPGLQTFSDAGRIAAALAFTLFLCAVSYRFFESRLMAWGHKFRY